MNKFNDLLSSTCQVSIKRIVLDLESEAAWVLFPLGVTFYHWIFLFSRSKDGNANIAKCSVRISPRVTREKQNNNCVREKSLFCEAVDNLAQSWEQLGISLRDMPTDV